MTEPYLCWAEAHGKPCRKPEEGACRFCTPKVDPPAEPDE